MDHNTHQNLYADFLEKLAVASTTQSKGLTGREVETASPLYNKGVRPVKDLPALPKQGPGMSEKVSAWTKLSHDLAYADFLEATYIQKEGGVVSAGKAFLKRKGLFRKQVSDKAKTKVKSFADTVKDKATEYAGKAKEKWNELPRWGKNTAIGGAGLLAGAGAASATSSNRRKDD